MRPRVRPVGEEAGGERGGGALQVLLDKGKELALIVGTAQKFLLARKTVESSQKFHLETSDGFSAPKIPFGVSERFFDGYSPNSTLKNFFSAVPVVTLIFVLTALFFSSV